jgi:integrase
VGIVRAKRPQRIPVVLTPAEVANILRELKGVYWLIACLQYGSGLRLLESVRLRVKDLDFDHRAILVRDGKGGKDRVVTLPDELVVPLKRHLENRRTSFERDCAQGVGTVYLPFALAHKYPNAPSEETTGSTLYLIVAIQLRLHLPLRPDVFRLGLNLRKIGDSAQWHYLRHLSSHAPSLARRGGGGVGKVDSAPFPRKREKEA